MPVNLEFAAKTDTGLVRSQNEDAVAVEADIGVVVLADGMGGYEAGEVASRIAIESAVRSLRDAHDANPPDGLTPEMLASAVRSANDAILAAARATPAYAGMGTTLVVAVVQPGNLTIAHVGDSRAYRLRSDNLLQLTRDHSLLQEQIDAGLLTVEQARYAANRNLVTRAVGVDSMMEAEVHVHAMQAGDLYLLCSDGLSDMLDDNAILAILKQHGTDLDATCGILVDEANRQGGNDNISVILFRQATSSADANDGGRNGLLERLRGWMS
ncbi:Stp1/IreP family PP2C-type Ser/Thr phosphatase [Noviherbaspirillum galbum]|uniref:Stp1/IreP family PP2C-type Ser/Thr phosphatase n=1 Tax=Noviherbaspirillum galbum TaxID=2709383 RepID=A0A6B3SPN9_9BURK|nr:Stp1/IreP family PP2C-type Ser/Thr phosphatase [Noviherbaspirillum galbum]NEX60686.1 Stp1/IreP family PP2C-type Ser/Thr phosphatase [Noviherbaspirillum galbum]